MSIITFPKESIHNGYNWGGEKELIQAWSYVKNDKEIITVRWYKGRSKGSSKVYCSVWICGNEMYCSGTGTSKRPTGEVLEMALKSANVLSDPPFDINGEYSAMKTIKLIGSALGYPDGILIQH